MQIIWGWLKSSFGVFHNTLQKNWNEFFGQPKTNTEEENTSTQKYNLQIAHTILLLSKNIEGMYQNCVLLFTKNSSLGRNSS